MWCWIAWGTTIRGPPKRWQTWKEVLRCRVYSRSGIMFMGAWITVWLLLLQTCQLWKTKIIFWHPQITCYCFFFYTQCDKLCLFNKNLCNLNFADCLIFIVSHCICMKNITNEWRWNSLQNLEENNFLLKWRSSLHTAIYILLGMVSSPSLLP